MSETTNLREAIREEIRLALPEFNEGSPPPYLSTKQVSELTGLSVSFFEVGRSMNSPGQPPFHRVGRRILYKRADIDAWISAHRRGASDD